MFLGEGSFISFRRLVRLFIISTVLCLLCFNQYCHVCSKLWNIHNTVVHGLRTGGSFNGAKIGYYDSYNVGRWKTPVKNTTALRKNFSS